VILAAGKGSRIGTKVDLKPLLQFGGMSLIERQLRTFYHAGVRDFSIVVGHAAKHLSEALEQLALPADLHFETLYNPNWEKGNGSSFYVAAEKQERPFLLTMADHLLGARIVQDFMQSSVEHDDLVLAVDRPRQGNEHIDLADVTKVQLKGQKITAIGKELPDYQAYDTGLFLFNSSIRNSLPHFESMASYSLSDIVGYCAQNSRASAVWIPPVFWADIDTPEDLKRAETLWSTAASDPTSVAAS